MSSAPAQWSSNLKFLLIAVGTEAGIANVWKFSYLAGANGGGLFVALYFAALVLIGMPALMAEMLIGRHGGANTVDTLEVLVARDGIARGWKSLGLLATVAVFLILSYYSVICGWMVRYLALGVTGGFAGVDAAGATALYQHLLADPLAMLGYSAVILGLTAVIVAGGVNRGIERVAAVLTPLRLIILLGLFGYSAVFADLGAAARFLFTVDVSRLTPAVVITALGQAFFSLGIGVGVMLTLGAYMQPRYSIPRAVLTVALAQGLVALIAGLAIFPLVFTYGLAPTQGPGLVFLTLPVAFAQMPYGGLFGSALFLTLSFAALTATSVILESLVSVLLARTPCSRRVLAVGCAALIWLAGIPTVLSFNRWSGWFPLTLLGLSSTKTPFDLLDYLTSNLMMPLGGLMVVLIAGWALPRAVAAHELRLSAPAFAVWRALVRYLVPLALVVIFLSVARPAHAAEPPWPRTPEADAFHTLLEEYWQDWLDLNPGLALSLGDARYQDRFDESLEDAWRSRLLALLDRYLARTAGIAAQSLSPADATSLGMLRERLAAQRQYYGGPLFETARRLPIDQFQGLHTAFAADAAGSGDYPFKTPADYAHALQRADGFAAWTRAAMRRLREGLASGDVLPALVVKRILPQLQAHVGRAPENTEFWQPIANLPAAFAPEERARLTAAYRRKIADVIEPAYRRLYDFLKSEYLPRARHSVGLAAIPGGAALYAYDVRFHTTTDLTPAQIHALGRSEVRRIEAELAQVQRSLHAPGTLAAFFAAVRADPTLKFAHRADIIPAFAAARRRIEGRLPMLFDVFPHAAFEIRALPDSSRHSQGNGYYAPAGAEGSRPGILWINTYAAGVTDRFNVMTLVLHEGLPGHHFQTSVAAEQADLPAFRRYDFTNAYGEGWALYAEWLGNELGMFADPLDHYGHLNYEILRANRLVIDTGLHAFGWDVEKGVRWMMQHSSMTRAQATAEVERYVAAPGQALSYKIGELKIRALRARAEAALGSGFDLKAFHDQILKGGSRPLSILESDIDRWIESQRPAAAP